MRLLIIAEGATLAHVGRPLLIAEEAARQGIDVVFARPARYAWMTREAAFNVVDLDTQSPEVFSERLAKGSPLYEFDTLDSYVQVDRELLRRFRPDAVIGDFRLSLAVSARLESCHYTTLSNAYWSPYYAIANAWPVPDLPLTHVMPIALARSVFNLLRPFAFALHARPMNQLRQKYGLNTRIDLQTAYTDADLVCYCDLPGLFELRGAPGNHCVVGPLVWSPQMPCPDAWADLREDLPTLYITLGSSGRADLLAPTVDALACDRYQIIVSSAGKLFDIASQPNVFHSSMVPGDMACERADLVICNGGSPTSQQALRAGKPVLGVPCNLDQFLNMDALSRRGVGLVVRSDRFSARRVQAAVETLLHDQRGRHAVLALTGEVGERYSNRRVAGRVIDDVRAGVA